MSRRLASIQKIVGLTAIKGADRIEIAQVLGWEVVVQKGIHAVGDDVVFYEVDAFLPAEDTRYASFSERFITWEGKRGMRLRTIRLRKVLSQGLIMPLKEFPELVSRVEGDDVTEQLGVLKWELSEAACSNGGRNSGVSFPSFIPRTDQERVQNIGRKLEGWKDKVWEVTLKMDGSSITVFRLLPSSEYYESFAKQRGVEDGSTIYAVCSRNVLLPAEGSSIFHEGAAPLLESLALLPDSYGSIALQGELLAPGIQGNYEQVEGVEVHLYDVYDIDSQEYFTALDRCGINRVACFTHVKVLEFDTLLAILPGFTPENGVQKLLAYASGPGYNAGVRREGVVFKSSCGQHSFKAVSNEYLEATGK